MIERGTAREHLWPASVAEAREMMRERAESGATLAFIGGSTEFGLGYDPERIDALVETRGLDRIVEHVPGDQIVTVEGGVTLAALQAALAPHRQRLALDPAQPERATLGGLIATNGFGPRRLRYGTLRDLIVGVSVVRADGTLVRGGGKVVKNVAGFDLPKLIVGSLGTLGLVATATLRLHPVPECTRWYEAFHLSADDVREICRSTVERRLEPSAVVACVEPDALTWTLQVLFEGSERGVRGQGDAWLGLANARDVLAAERGDESVPVRDETFHPHGSLRVRISAPPAAFGEIDRQIVRPLRVLLRGEVVAYPMVGTLVAAGRPRDVVAAPEVLQQARAAVERLGGNLVVAEMEPDLRARIDPWGTLPPSFPLMRNLKERFDPQRRLNRGRFLGRL